MKEQEQFPILETEVTSSKMAGGSGSCSCSLIGRQKASLYYSPCLFPRIREFIHTKHRNTTLGLRPGVVLRCCTWINSRIRVSKLGVTDRIHVYISMYTCKIIMYTCKIFMYTYKIIMYTCKIIMYTCILNHVYMQNNYVYIFMYTCKIIMHTCKIIMYA